MDTASQLLPAFYNPSKLPECAGNPLIEALPPFRTAMEVLPFFSRKPHFATDERELPAATRLLCISRLNDYLLTMPNHADVLEQLGLVIHSGYVHRNPVLPEYKRSLVHFYRESMAGRIQPIVAAGPSTAPSFSLFGVSGVGKSTVLEHALSFYPRALSHSEHGFMQLVWLKVDCPLDGSLKQLLISIVSKIDATLGTAHSKHVNDRTTVDKLIVDVAKIAAQHHLGVLVIDEIQHLLASSGVGPEKMLNFFVTFANEVKVPFVISGTPKAKTFLGTLFREARRLSDHGSTTWDRMQPGAEWDFFLQSLWKYQWLKKARDLDPKLSEAMYFQTQGITALVVRLFQLVQHRAIRGKIEQITVGLINKVAKEKFALLELPLAALRSGNQEKIDKFEDFLTAGITELLLTRSEEQAHSAKKTEAAMNTERARLTSNLLLAGQDPKLVGAAVNKLFSVDGIRGGALSTLVKDSRSVKVANKLLDILKDAEASGTDVSAAFKKAGLIADVSEGAT